MTQPTGMRTIFERMTNPTQDDLAVNARLQALKRADVMRMVDHMCQVMEHLAHQRDDLSVERITEDGAHGFSVRLVTTMPENPLVLGTKPPQGPSRRDKRSKGRR